MGRRRWAGTLLSDRYTAYDTVLKERVHRDRTAAACMAHARRKFDELAQADTSALAEEAIRRFGRMYEVEDIVYFLFDAPFLGGKDLRQVPLISRLAALQQILAERGNDRVRFSDAFDAAPSQLLDAACQIGLEGILLKRVDAPYTSKRSETSLKLKCHQHQEFVVIGSTDRSSARNEVGGLLLGYHEEAALRYGGSVGTDWSTRTGRELHAQQVALEVDLPAVDPGTDKLRALLQALSGHRALDPAGDRGGGGVRGRRPDGHVCHPTFRGVQSDKPG